MRVIHHGTKHSRVDAKFFETLGGIGPSQAMSPRKIGEPDAVQVADVVVVGSGAAGLAAACAAAQDGARVVVLEKAAIWGGTTRRSGGVFHIYNNVLMREAGIDDPKEDALKYLCRCAYPTLFNPNDDRYGLPEAEFNLIEAYYDYGSDSIEALTAMGAADLTAPALDSPARMSTGTNPLLATCLTRPFADSSASLILNFVTRVPRLLIPSATTPCSLPATTTSARAVPAIPGFTARPRTLGSSNS